MWKHWTSWLSHIYPIKRPHKYWDEWNTDRYLNAMEEKNVEWETPPELPNPIHSYRWFSYTIDRNWIVRWKNWEIIEYKMKNKKPVVFLRKERMYDWKFIKRRECNSVLKLMERYYWRYFRWYIKHLKKPENYELVPLDWNYCNMKYDNLAYKEKNTKRVLIETLSKELSPNLVAQGLGVTQNLVMQVLRESWDNKYYNDRKRFQDKYWIKFNINNFEIYKILIESWWILQNSEIYEILCINNNELKSKLSVKKIEAIRANLKKQNNWLIQDFEDIEPLRNKAIEMIRGMSKTGLKIDEIACMTWLTLSQVKYLFQLNKKQKNR